MRFYLDYSPVYISLYHQKRRPINSELNTNFHGEKILVFVTPKAQVTKKKKGKLDFDKIKTFCPSKDTIKKAKRQAAI